LASRSQKTYSLQLSERLLTSSKTLSQEPLVLKEQLLQVVLWMKSLKL